MYGIVTRNEPELAWDAFERGFYEVKSASGRQRSPVDTGVNAVVCHGDTAASERPALVAVDDGDEPATPGRDGFDWGYVCPSHDGYRTGLLELVDVCADAYPHVRLDDVGFPRASFCYCNRCLERYERSEHEDWYDWRASVVDDFLAAARARVPGRLHLAVHPDPYPGRLRRRTGLDLEIAAAHADELIVPLYDPAYATTYWLDVIAGGFRDAVTDADLAVELYAVDVDVDALIAAVSTVDPHVDAVYFGYDAGTARAALRRMRAAEAAGRTFGTPS